MSCVFHQRTEAITMRNGEIEGEYLIEDDTLGIDDLAWGYITTEDSK